MYRWRFVTLIDKIFFFFKGFLVENCAVLQETYEASLVEYCEDEKVFSPSTRFHLHRISESKILMFVVDFMILLVCFVLIFQ